ncbi:MAG: potassium channel protein [Bacteroidia bacterium]|nr:potassium channel protein [Bacteroidia bacterium]
MKKTDSKRLVYSLIGLVLFYGVIILLLHRIESDVPDSKMHSWQDGLWYVVATITTVGYGDVIPVTYWGRTLGFVVMLSSLGIYGFIISQITNFMNTIKERKELGLNGTNFKNHVVIIGWNEFSHSVIGHLAGAGREIAIVTKDRSSIDIIKEYHDLDKIFTLYADFNNFEMLEKANIREASVVFVNMNDDTEKLVYVINLKKHFADLNYVVTLDNGNLKNTFHAAGVTYAISKNEISSKLLASYIYEPDVAILTEEIIAYAHQDDEYDMKQIMVKANNPFAGIFYEKVFFDLKKHCNVVLFGIVKVTGSVRKLMKNPDGDIKVEVGDYLIILMDGKGGDKLKRHFLIDEGI